MDRIIFCVFEDIDYKVYCELLPNYFAGQNKKVVIRLATKQQSKKDDTLESLREAVERQTRRATESEEMVRQEVLKSKRFQDLASNLERSNEEKSRRIQTLENRVRRLEGDLNASQKALEEANQHADRLDRERLDMEGRLANSDTVFQDVLQRLLGQIPQSQPFWVVERQEIHLTPEKLGEGGWANVSVAIFRGQRVAAKCLHNEIISAHNVRLFTREMNIAAQARHPNLLQFIGATIDGHPIILTELLPTSLRRLMESTRLSKPQVKSISCDVARALNYLHLTLPDPIIHRDISSANVLLEASGEGSWKAKVCDYGSANFVRYTTTVHPGSPLYSAPESGDPKKHSPKMDVYSFGILLIEMCSGKVWSWTS